MAVDALHAALAELLGPVFVTQDETTCAQFSVQGLVPGCVAAPGTLEELAAVMALAHEHGAVVVPWGGGTQQMIGRPPARVELVVRTERLNRVLIHEPADLTISVEAGMTLGALRSYLAQHNQMLPIDPPLANSATIGGLIATAMDGPRRLSYGTLRDLLIGITVVEASGRVSKAGGMVVKNVSGFDMMKLYHGSFGTLAVIAAANFKLLPAPRASALIMCQFPSRESAFAMLAALHESQLTPGAAEYLSAGALAALDLPGTCGVAVLSEGLPQAVARHVRDIGELARARGGTAEEAPDMAGLWTRITNMPQVAQLAPDEAVVKLALLPGELEMAIARIEELGGRAAISARALDGVAYARLRGVDAAQLARLVERVPGVQWIATPVAGAPRWGQFAEGAELMQRIKDEFDPHHVLNRGRFLSAEQH